MYADAVFEGGGVKGIGIVGAVCRFEENGYEWHNLAGTSAGAIIAALLSVGYSGNEIKEIFLNTDYRCFQDKDTLQSFPLIGSALGFIMEKSIFCGDFFEKWISRLLKEKGKVRFKDVSQNGVSRLKIIASDISRRKMLVLPDDISEYGYDPMELKISKAVRMSMSIPFYFKPVKLKFGAETSYIVDGGLLSNFPVWIFDVEGVPRWPTFGFKLVEPGHGFTASGNTNIISYTLDVIGTMIETIDEIYVKNSDFIRTIAIPTLGVGTVDFGISKKKKLELFNSGYQSAQDFINTWDFNKYISRYRTGRKIERREGLLS